MFDKVENLAPSLLINDRAFLYLIMIISPVAINLYLRIRIRIHVFSMTITTRQRVKGNHLSDQTKGYQASLQVDTQSFSFPRLRVNTAYLHTTSAEGVSEDFTCHCFFPVFNTSWISNILTLSDS